MHGTAARKSHRALERLKLFFSVCHTRPFLNQRKQRLLPSQILLSFNKSSEIGETGTYAITLNNIDILFYFSNSLHFLYGYINSFLHSCYIEFYCK